MAQIGEDRIVKRLNKALQLEELLPGQTAVFCRALRPKLIVVETAVRSLILRTSVALGRLGRCWVLALI